MFNTITKVQALLSRREKLDLSILAVIVSVAALFETLGVASILPYMALLTTPESAIAQRVFAYVSDIYGTHPKEQIVVFVGIFVFCGVVVGTLISGLATWLALRFAMLRAHTISLRILKSYLNRDYEFYIQRHSSGLLKNLLSEVSNVVGGVLTPLIQMCTRLVVVMLLVVLLFIVDAVVATVSVGIFLAIYLMIYSLSKRGLTNLGAEAVKLNSARYQILAELFGGIREVKLWNKEEYYCSAFSRVSERFADVNARSQLIALLPRYGLEMVAFGGMILVTIVLATSNKEFSSYVPLLSLYAVAGYKLLPSLQQIYMNLAAIRYSAASLGVFIEESKLWMAESSKELAGSGTTLPIRSLREEIKFENVIYHYPGSKEPALGPINIRIPAFSTTGIIGPSGAGKSTLLDLMLGLLQPTSGEIRVDGEPIAAELRQGWANAVGYVPQSIYLTDGTVTENIAFGTPSDSIDFKAVEAAARSAQIYDLVQTLPEKFATRLGERGLRLSGGQRQRIAIARALYRNPAILIFDEATSALDSETEGAVMEAVRSLAHKKTIVIVTHRVSTLRDCDHIYLLENGKMAREMLAGDLFSLSSQMGMQGEKW